MLKDIVNGIVTITIQLPEKTSVDPFISKLSLTRNAKVFEIAESINGEPPRISHAQFLHLISKQF